jgi:acetyl-CoA carboxylase biotin carboxyl carrier protein
VSSNPKKAGPTTSSSGPFDVKIVESLVSLMTEHDLSEIYLRDGSQHLRLRRGAAASTMVPATVPVMPAVAAPLAPSLTNPKAEPAASKKNLLEIKSETIGTFYAQSKPGEPPYVKLGSTVKPDTPVGVIEVMKTYNEVQANCTGVIVEILAENGKYVDFNEVLFRVDPS